MSGSRWVSPSGCGLLARQRPHGSVRGRRLESLPLQAGEIRVRMGHMPCARPVSTGPRAAPTCEPLRVTLRERGCAAPGFEPLEPVLWACSPKESCWVRALAVANLRRNHRAISCSCPCGSRRPQQCPGSRVPASPKPSPLPALLTVAVLAGGGDTHSGANLRRDEGCGALGVCPEPLRKRPAESSPAFTEFWAALPTGRSSVRVLGTSPSLT